MEMPFTVIWPPDVGCWMVFITAKTSKRLVAGLAHSALATDHFGRQVPGHGRACNESWRVRKRVFVFKSFSDLTTRNKKLLGAPGHTTRSKDATRGSWPYY